MRPTSVLFLALLGPGCLVDYTRYQALEARLVDADGDGWDISGGDCDDANPAVHPATADGCDGVDQDCDGAIDEDVDKVWYLDADGDTFGHEASVVRSCVPSRGWAEVPGDCNDDNPRVHPGATESCDLVDEDCNEIVDDGFATTPWYPDLDLDGVGNAAGVEYTCKAPDGYVRADSDSDCDDTDATIHPGASEVCADGVDNDCDGAALGCDWAGDLTTLGSELDVLGVDGGDGVGHAVATADVNGDSYDDIVVGSAAGRGVWVVSGSTAALGNDVLLNTRDPLLTMTPHPSDFSSAFVFGQAVALCEDGAGTYDIVTTGFQEGFASFLFVFDGSRVGSLDTGSVLDTFPAADLADAALLCRDLDDDGISDLVIGTPAYDSASATNTGAVHILGGASSSGGTERTSLDAPTEATTGNDAGQALGASIALVDLDADGTPDLLAGAADVGAPDAGLAWLIPEPAAGGDLSASARRLVGPSSGAGAVAAGDLDGDGLDDVVIGAPDDNSGWTGAGAVYVVNGRELSAGDGSLQVVTAAEARLSGHSASMHFGATVAVAPGADGERGRLIVGAVLDDGAGPDAGAVYLWDGVALTGSGSSGSATAVWRGAAAGDNLGRSLDLSGDLDADGYRDLLLGAPGYDGPGVDAGAVHVFIGSGL